MLKWVEMIEKQNWWRIMKIWELEIHNPTFEDVFWKDIKRFLDWQKQPNDIKFDVDRTIFLDRPTSIVLRYSSEIERNKDIRILNAYFQMENEYISKKLEWDRQLPQVAGYFDYGWNYYLVLRNYHSQTDETDSEQWVYKWIYVNPQKYCEQNWLEIPLESMDELDERISWDLADNLTSERE